MVFELVGVMSPSILVYKYSKKFNPPHILRSCFFREEVYEPMIWVSALS
jgi:hypothetical protein